MPTTITCSGCSTSAAHYARSLCRRCYRRNKHAGTLAQYALASKAHLSPSERLWLSVDKAGPTRPHMDTPCWVWTSGTNGSGYGQLQGGKGRPVLAHRLSWALHRGAPKSMCVLHRCDTPACVRPGHLFLGTRRDNMADMVAKGRGHRGARTGGAKLTDDDVRTIRDLWPDESQTAIARRFGVRNSTIHDIVRRKTWTHIG